MLDSIEWIELSVFEQHYYNLKAKWKNEGIPILVKEKAVLLYFEDRIKFLKEKKDI